MECSHLLDNVKLNSEFNIEDITITKNFQCSECAVTEQNWLCLQCGIISCGRYINGHAKQHSESFDHQLCMSCDVYSVYCYKCDEYVSNDTNEQSIHKIRQSIMKSNNSDTDHTHKNEDDDGELLDGNNECISNSNKSITEISEKNTSSETPQNSSCNLEEVPTDVTENTGNVETRFQKNSEDSIRSLRTRSRKRSHSADTSSTENNTQTSKSKEKKVSPVNGKNHREKKIVGLKNLGNTCFMNAVLQSLNNIQEFSCYFSQLPSLEVKTNGRKVYHSRSYTRQEMNDVIMAEELRKVLINLNNGGCGSKGATSPECLFLVIWKVVPRFRGYQQQDAHEFLRYMLDRLHTELLQLLPPDKADVGLSRVPSASIVTAVFGGTLQSEVRCLVCDAESKKLDPFLDLSLELPECGRHDAPVCLADCLASFVQVEQLADSERYFCNSCKCKQRSTKQFCIRRLPNVLCLHLKRFRWNNYFRTKVDTNISFPLRSLDMSRFVLAGAGGVGGAGGAAGAGGVCGAAGAGDARRAARPGRSARGSQLYDLAAVIVHHGSGAGSGHYTAFAINEEQWFHFNDQTVRAVDASAVASCKPYIMFYIRREFSLPAAT